ncbi:hypothetical protein C8N46_11320 [Kordia periserrulae]|uniref:Uncharacterized protein n=1 Tax=Kordia periserrulae TaxID=701523 RepID=A0A2T6BR21_9FLAO|nr:hypothetical protein C8N46_11320 [Kordia periserrulae]
MCEITPQKEYQYIQALTKKMKLLRKVHKKKPFKFKELKGFLSFLW